MSQRLPEFFDPRRPADLSGQMSGQIRLDRLSRLIEAIEGGEPMVEVQLGIECDDQGRVILSGRVQARLTLECQRCLGPVAFPVDIGFRLAVVETLAQAERLPDELDPLLLADGGPLRLADMVEDELLLALPQVPMHQPGDCVEPLLKEDAVPPAEAANPFSVLKALKRQGD
jgi:uncharacterized protein